MDTEHRIVDRETLNIHTQSYRLTCTCGWWGHSTRWNDLDHKARGGEVAPLPVPAEPPRQSRREVHIAIYGNRHHCAKCCSTTHKTGQGS